MPGTETEREFGTRSGILLEKAGIDANGPEPRSTFVLICDPQVAGRSLNSLGLWRMGRDSNP